MQNDLIYIFQWWVMLLLIGGIFLPLTIHLFTIFFDKGYIFSKIIGISIVCYTLFAAGTLKILPFTQPAIFFVLAVFIFANLYLISKNLNILISLKNSWKIFLFEEILFFATLTFWSFIRGASPDVHGLEKYMDFGFMNSIARSDYFPPKDMWFTPFSINYYYFGHLFTTTLTKLIEISSSITFNLMVATIFAFTFTGAFSIGANLINQLKVQSAKLKATAQNLKVLMLAGFLSAFLISFAGNIHTIYTIFKPYQNENPVPFWQLVFSPSSFPNNYWYPNATRFIENTIHEFPIYSFVVSDLHGHVLDIPFVLLTIALLFSLIQNAKIKNQNHNSKFKIFNFKFSLSTPFLAFLLAVMYMTNAWDGIVYAFLTFLIFLYLSYRSKNYTQYAIRYALIIVGFIVFSLPFSLHFKPFVSGIGVICAPEFLTNIEKAGPFLFEKDHCQHSPWWQLAILYGFFYFWVISFLVFLRARLKFESRSDIFVFLLITLSTILIIIPEFIYIKDIYPAHYRANTMFKLVYQSFMMLSIASGYIILRIVLSIMYYVLRSNTRKKILTTCYILLATFLLFLVSVYPYFSINSYYGNLQTYYGLDGTVYLERQYKNDYSAIVWLNKNIKGQPVILEAQGDSYTDYARVSANTGLPTVLGWTVHEWLWRGTYDVPAPRIEEIKTIYETTESSIAKQILDKHNVKLIFIGDLERQKYVDLKEEKFNILGKIIYQNGQTKIYEIY